jgi:hypothetical protein
MERIVHIFNTATPLYVAPQTLPSPLIGASDSPMEVTVIFTDPETTRNALKTAALLAGGLNARVRLVVPQVVPYALPLNEPPIPTGFTEQRICLLVADLGVDTEVDICLCRNKRESLLCALRPHSVTVVGGRRRWWPTWEKRLAKQLRRSGHEVIFTETE